MQHADDRRQSSVQHSVAVVQSRPDDAAGDSTSRVVGRQLPHITQNMYVIVYFATQAEHNTIQIQIQNKN